MGILLSIATFLFVKEPERGRQIRIKMANQMRKEEKEQEEAPIKEFKPMSNELVKELKQETGSVEIKKLVVDKDESGKVDKLGLSFKLKSKE